MKYLGSSFPQSLFGILDIIGLDFALTTMRRASTIFLSSAPVLFSRALLTNPRTVGAACPSSSRLARAIANQVTLPGKDELILELGGGTGMVTRALLRRGVEPGKLVVVEQNKLLARHLKKQFPKVAVIHGNAVKLCQLCNRYKRRIGTVVSSLPLLSLSPATVQALGIELQTMLDRNGSLIQYTYRLNNIPGPLTAFLEFASAETVWGNFPPARVEVFRAREKGPVSRVIS